MKCVTSTYAVQHYFTVPNKQGGWTFSVELINGVVGINGGVGHFLKLINGGVRVNGGGTALLYSSE